MDSNEAPSLSNSSENRRFDVAERSTIHRISVLIPCHNEETANARVVCDFRNALPGAAIYVYDNNSQDRTLEAAAAAGAVVRRETLQGKGYAVRRMFSDVEAEAYVLVDGDATYEAAAAPRLIERIEREHFDMVVGARVGAEDAAYRRGHRFGNAVLSAFVARLFGLRFTDMLSGYRVFSRRFVKSFPALARGFEIETELTVHALELGLSVAEEPTKYCARPKDSRSKLRTYHDGLRIVRLIVRLYKDEHPLRFFGAFAGLLGLVSLTLGLPVVIEFIRTGLVPRLPTAVLASALALLAALSVTCGLILDTVTRGRKEVKRMAYLRVPR